MVYGVSGEIGAVTHPFNLGNDIATILLQDTMANNVQAQIQNQKLVMVKHLPIYKYVE